MLEYDRKAMGIFLRESREKTHFTQTQVAKKMGYSSPQFISNIERGASVAPLNMLSKLLRIYGRSPGPMMKIIMDSQAKLLREKLKRAK